MNGITRRKLLRHAGTAAGCLMVGGAWPRTAWSQDTLDADVIVVGAGLAGLSTAFELAEQGARVLVLEGRPYVGGRTSSWVHEDMPVESGLHRFLGWYVELPALLERAGIRLNDIVYWENQVELRVPDGPTGIFGASLFHKPWATIRGALANNEILSPTDKASIARFFTAALRDFALQGEGLDDITVLQYAMERGVTYRAIQNALIPLTAGVFFYPPELYSMWAFTTIIAPVVPRLPLQSIGAFTGGMTEVMAGPLARAVEARGGVVVTGQRVDALVERDGRVRGVRSGTQELSARGVVLATTLDSAQHLVTRSLPGVDWFEPMLRLRTMSSVTMQLELDAPCKETDLSTYSGGISFNSYAEQSRTTFKGTAGRLSVIMSHPWRYLRMPADALLDVVERDAERVGLRVKGHVQRYRKVTEPLDFYAVIPGQAHLRPPQRTPIPGLALAGDYTRQPMVGTMEGAVISGQAAAREMLRQLETSTVRRRR